jgi:hypothetical protein
VKKRLALTTAVALTAICAPAAQAIGVPAQPPAGVVGQFQDEQAVPVAPPGGYAAWSRPAPRAVASPTDGSSTTDGFDFADAAVGLGVGLGVAFLALGRARGRRSVPADA